VQPVHVIAAVRHDDQNAIASEPTREIRKQFERRWVGEMDILDNKDERL
jgi:hypothetical protein